MTDTDGWFAAVDRDDPDAMAAAIREGRADEPHDWPALALEAAFAKRRGEYYDALRDATTARDTGRGDRARAGRPTCFVHAVRSHGRLRSDGQ